MEDFILKKIWCIIKIKKGMVKINMKKIMLCILDGLGVTNNTKGNAFYNAKTPNIDYLLKNYPNTLIEASGTYVGLPEGQMGNSEVGHMTIGGGKVIYQSLEYINRKIKNNEFKTNKEFLHVIKHVKDNNSKLHLMGLLSDGGVHSSIYHLFKLLEMCKENNLEQVYIHVFTDGRDTDTKSSIKFVKMLEDKIKELKIGIIASISGRYYVMDRDNRYERIKKSYDVMVNGKEYTTDTVSNFIEKSYEQGITDEFINPALFDKKAIIDNNDGIIVYNFRPDRLREILTVLTDDNFKEFSTKKINNLDIVSMMMVNEKLKTKYAFSLDKIDNPLGVYIDNLGLSQLRIAETEKYAHVTYFFDGGKERELAMSKRILVPSPKVATYDLKPEMSAMEINEELEKAINEKEYDLIVLNYANCDMVGHTGKYEKALIAVETVDKCLGQLINKYQDKYTFLVTADHGNCEKMLNEDGTVNTAHTNNKVFFIITENNLKLKKEGSLKDIAPTILELFNLKVPNEMTGQSLITK